MGIRIHKCVGYGVKISCSESGKICDSRLNFNGQEDFHVDGFIDWWSNNHDLVVDYAKIDSFDDRESRVHCQILQQTLSRKKAWNASSIIHSPDGILDLLLLIPPSCCKSWQRYDDVIDWIEETENCNQESRVQWLETSPYPYEGFYVRFRNHAISSHINPKVSTCNYNKVIGKFDHRVPPEADGEMLQHFLCDWRPRIPIELIAYMLWTNILSDFNGILNNLRPCLYAYWD